ncbi:MAG: purine-nucleoside phosphorylase [Bacteroidaceae bacterium]|nr:purine-nucleoside phosphorylase [Bacteroidaceae bacterium]
MYTKIQQTSAWLLERMPSRPTTAIILGSGLGQLVSEITDKTEIAYRDIPYFPITTVEGHTGKLIFGKLQGVDVVAMMGRFHYYEGYDMQTLTYPVRVLRFIGVENLFVSNAAGGTNPTFKVGDVMIIKDHINLFPDNPLRGKNYSEWGERFPSMTEAYNRQYIAYAKAIANKYNFNLKEGVYAGTSGPSYETPAEYRYFRAIGADAVGMSTIPEVIVARHMEMKVFGVSVITNVGGGEDNSTNHEEVQQIAQKVQHIIGTIAKEIIPKFG